MGGQWELRSECFCLTEGITRDITAQRHSEIPTPVFLVCLTAPYSQGCRWKGHSFAHAAVPATSAPSSPAIYRRPAHTVDGGDGGGDGADGLADLIGGDDILDPVTPPPP